VAQLSYRPMEWRVLTMRTMPVLPPQKACCTLPLSSRIAKSISCVAIRHIWQIPLPNRVCRERHGRGRESDRPTSMSLLFIEFEPVEYRARIGLSKYRPTAASRSTVARIAAFFRPLRVFLPIAVVNASAADLRVAWDSPPAPWQFDEFAIALGLSALMVVGFAVVPQSIVARRRRGGSPCA